MLFIGLLVLVISSYSMVDFLRADVSSNKFDVQSIGSVRGLAGQNGFGDVISKSTFGASLFITPFYNSGSSSWGLAGSKTSNLAKPSGGTGATYDYGILEENGFWNAAGLFFGFAHPDFLLPDVIAKGIPDSENLGSTVDRRYSTLLYYAPKDYEMKTGVVYASTPSAVGMHKGFGELPADVKLLFGDVLFWDQANYQNFYQAFLKNIGVTGDALALHNQVTPDAAGATAYPDLSGIRSTLMPDDYSYPPGGDVNGQIVLNPYLRKVGSRFVFSATPYTGVTFNARVGVADLRVNATAKEPVAGTTNNAYPISNNFGMLSAVLEDLGATLDDYHQQALEDAYLSLTAGQGFVFGNKAQDVSDLVVYPFVTGGVWVPTSRNYEVAEGNKYCLYVPLGNEGHVGYTVGAGVSLDFKDVMCLTFGAGTTLFDTISIKDYRMPNHRAQRGFYPFKIDVSRKKGQQCYGYVSLKSINCEDGVAFYCDFVYSKHRQDVLTLCDANSKRNELFKEGRVRMEAQSLWSVFEGNFGLSFTLSENVQMGFALTTNFKGVALPSMRTICGSGIFTF